MARPSADAASERLLQAALELAALALDAREPLDAPALARRVLAPLEPRGVAIWAGEEVRYQVGELVEPVIEVEGGEPAIRLQVAIEPAPVGVERLLQALVGRLAERERLVAAQAGLRHRIHDLRGALAVVTGQREMLEAGVWGELNERQARAVETMERHLERLDALLCELRAGSTSD